MPRPDGSTNSLLNYDRPHNILLSSIYQMPNFTSSKGLGMLIAKIDAWPRFPLYCTLISRAD